MLLLPELSIFFYAVICLFFSISRKKSGITPLAMLMSLAVFILTVVSFGSNGEIFSGAYKIDQFSHAFKIIISFGLCIVVLMNICQSISCF